MSLRKTILTFACIALIVLAGCPQQEPQEDQPASSSGAMDTEIGQALASDKRDEHLFAYLAITAFGLDVYAEQLLKRAEDDSVAAAALTAITGIDEPLRAYCNATNSDLAIHELLGAVNGLNCASDVPAEFWSWLLAEAGASRPALLRGLAVLDVSPGGPVKLESDFASMVITLLAATPDDPELKSLAGALFGAELDQPLHWPELAAQLGDSWTPADWIARLRWMDAADVDSMLSDPTHPGWPYLLVAVLRSPRDDYDWQRVLPLAAEAEHPAEQAALRFHAGETATMELPLLDNLLAGTPPAEDEAAPPMPENSFATLMSAVDYAAAGSDSAFLDKVIAGLAMLPESQRSGVMATLKQYAPTVLSDTQLKALFELEDRSVAFHLIHGWHTRHVVQQSHQHVLLRVSASHENVIMAEAYNMWRRLYGETDSPAAHNG